MFWTLGFWPLADRRRLLKPFCGSLRVSPAAGSVPGDREQWRWKTWARPLRSSGQRGRRLRWMVCRWRPGPVCREQHRVRESGRLLPPSRCLGACLLVWSGWGSSSLRWNWGWSTGHRQDEYWLRPQRENRCSRPSDRDAGGGFCTSLKLAFAERTMSRLPLGAKGGCPGSQ